VTSFYFSFIFPLKPLFHRNHQSFSISRLETTLCHKTQIVVGVECSELCITFTLMNKKHLGQLSWGWMPPPLEITPKRLPHLNLATFSITRFSFLYLFTWKHFAIHHVKSKDRIKWVCELLSQISCYPSQASLETTHHWLLWNDKSLFE